MPYMGGSAFAMANSLMEGYTLPSPPNLKRLTVEEMRELLFEESRSCSGTSGASSRTRTTPCPLTSGTRKSSSSPRPSWPSTTSSRFGSKGGCRKIERESARPAERALGRLAFALRIAYF